MNEELLARLKEITPEERRILDGDRKVQKELYTSGQNFIIDSRKLLEKGRLFEIRPGTRFIHFPKHRHNYVEMIYMCSGTTTHIINDTEKVVLQEGDLLILNQNVTQEILPAGENDVAINFIILPEFFDSAMGMIDDRNALYDFIVSSLSGEKGVSSYLHFRVHDILPVQNLIENMIWNLLKNKKHTNNLNRLSMGLLFLNLLTYADTVNRNEENHYEQNLVFSALKYVDMHYKDGTLEEFAESVQEKPYAVSRMLKRTAGKNFKEILMDRKLQQASYLLKRTALPAEDIYHAVGYENSSFFYRKFREKYGISPREYRRRNR
ncbi:MAG: AraC family transcriptional regulator [Lachnospiraceae bacterium]|jgi:YesN/AraC family two-component response regulator|nr:AraC family transcriptional regulator [Lachnospiraceae bacterium]